MTSIKTTEYGVRYDNGTEDWNTASWFGSIETPEQRKNFQEQYALRLEGLGVPSLPVSFLTRTKRVSYGATEFLEE